MINVLDIRKKFPIYKINPDLVYLDSSASALKVEDSINAVKNYYENLGVNVYRGSYNLSFLATKEYEDARQKVARFINANDDEIIFTRGTTSSLNIIANGLKHLINEGDEIISSELEHHSSFLPWLNVANTKNAKINFIPLTTEGKITFENFKKVFTNKTKVVAITHVSNVLGYLTPIKEIAKYAKEKGAIVILDAAQSVSHQKLDIQDLGIDFLAFSGHKMFGPTGVGVLYGKKNLLNILEPLEYGGEMVDQVYKDKATYKDAPFRLEAGTPVIASAIGLGYTIDFINEIGFSNIKAHTKKLHDYALLKISKLEGIKIYNKNAEEAIITFNVDDVHPHDIATYLDTFNVNVRAGHHCAQLVSKFLGVPATLRASFHIYNNTEDIDKFIEALTKARDFFKNF